MSDSINEQTQMSLLTNLLHASQNRFGELLRQVCELSGLTQGKLSREAKDERQRLIEQGDIHFDDLIGSMEQPAISKVMAGTQGPTYFQVYIWLRVIRTHYNSAQLTQICEKLGIDVPVFDKELEDALWHLSNFTSPEELRQVYEQTKDKTFIEIDDSIADHKQILWENNKRGFVAKNNHTSIKLSNNTKIASKLNTNIINHSKAYNHTLRSI